MTTALLDVKVLNVHRLPPDMGKIKAFVDLGINDCLLIKGVKIVDGKKGLFVSMPSEQGKDEKWYERVRYLNPDAKELIKQKVLDAFQEN